MWGGTMSAVDGRLTSDRSSLLGALLPSGPSWYLLSTLVPSWSSFWMLCPTFLWRSCSSRSWFGEMFHCSHEGLDLPSQGSGSQFISLNVVDGCHQASKYHVTLCPGSNSMANLLPHRRRQLMMPKKSPVSHTVLARLKQYLYNKKRRPNREHRYGAGQIPSEHQVRIFHHSRVLELGWIIRTYFLRVFGLL